MYVPRFGWNLFNPVIWYFGNEMSCDQNLRVGSVSSGGRSLLDKTLNCAIFYYTHHSLEIPLLVAWNFAASRGAGHPDEAKMLAEEADIRLHLVMPLLGCLLTCIGPPFLCTPSPQGVQEVEGVAPGEVGGLYPELWPDLWRTLRTAVMVQLLHRQLVTTSFGDASASLAVPERTPSLSPHQRLLLESAPLGLDSESSL